MKNLYITCFIFMMWFGSCSKTAKQLLPKATTDGKNTFGCLIDGKPFIAADIKDLFVSIKGLSARYSGGEQILSISSSAKASDGGSQNIDISLFPVTKTGTYKIEATSSLRLTYSANSKSAETDSLHTGFFTINRFDPTSLIFSGTFEATLVDKSGNALHITDGRFDLSLPTF